MFEKLPTLAVYKGERRYLKLPPRLPKSIWDFSRLKISNTPILPGDVVVLLDWYDRTKDYLWGHVPPHIVKNEKRRALLYVPFKHILEVPKRVFTPSGWRVAKHKFLPRDYEDRFIPLEFDDWNN